MTRESNMTELKEREAFEAAYRKEFPVSCECSPDKFARFGDTYENLQVLAAWRMWQVCRSAAILAAPGAPATATGQEQCCNQMKTCSQQGDYCKFSGAPAPVAPTERCPDCLGSEFPGLKRGVRCKTCNGTATVEVAPAPVAPTDTQRLDWLLQSDAVTRHEDGTATFAFVFANADDLRGAIDDLMGLAPPVAGLAGEL